MRADRQLRAAISWKDLLAMRRWETASELLLSMPWLAGSVAAAAYGRYELALPCSFMFFLTGLRQVHGAFHHSIGLPRQAIDRFLFVLSALMLGSMHAVQINHLRHHAHCLEDDDVEAMSARMPAWKALLTGPLFPIRLHVKALEVGTPSQVRWIRAELAATVCIAGAAILSGEPWLRYHAAVMGLGQCLTSFFAVWTVHHDCPPDGVFARTMRGALKSFVTYQMFYHVEHHLFPAVPTRRLPELARRLDEVAPEMSAKRVF